MKHEFRVLTVDEVMNGRSSAYEFIDFDKLKTMNILKVDKEQNGTMDVRVASSNKLLGCFMVSEDGYYNFWPLESITGYYSADALLELGNKLNEINKPWNDNITEYFNKQ
jgi:hypothetical protein